MPSYSRDSWHREPIYVTLFLAQRSPERFGTVLQTSGTVRNGSADINFARRYFSTASKPPKKRSRAVPPVSHFQNLPKSRTVAPRAKATRERSQKNDKGKATSPPKSLNRQCKGMLSTREKVKLDVATKGWKFLSCLFIEGVAPFKILPVLKTVLWNLF